MAAGALPKPGTKYGPCRTKCGHVDCDATRKQAAASCLVCSKPIGFGVPVYGSREGWRHASCAEIEVGKTKDRPLKELKGREQ